MPNNSDGPTDGRGNPLEAVQLKGLPTLPIMKNAGTENRGLWHGGGDEGRISSLKGKGVQGAATVLCLVCDGAQHTATLCQNSENYNRKG